MNHLGLHLFFSIAFCSVLVAQTAPKPLNVRIVPGQELKRESTIPQKAPYIFVPDTIKAIQKTEPQPEIKASENAKTDTPPSPPKKTTVATKPPSISNLPTSVRYIGTGTFELSFDVSEPCFLESGAGGVLVWFNDQPMARVSGTLTKSGETYVFRTTIAASAPAGPANVKIKATNKNGATTEITNTKFVIYPEIGNTSLQFVKEQSLDIEFAVSKVLSNVTNTEVSAMLNNTPMGLVFVSPHKDGEKYLFRTPITENTKEGLATTLFRVKDGAGNISEIRTKQILVDTTAPQISLFRTESKYRGEGPFWVKFRVSESVSLPLGKSKINATFNGEDMTLISVNYDNGAEDYIYQATVAKTTKEGPATIGIHAQDAAGNISTKQDSSVTVDLTQPLISNIMLEKQFVRAEPIDLRFELNKLIVPGVENSKIQVLFNDSPMTAHAVRTLKKGTRYHYQKTLGDKETQGPAVIQIIVTDAVGNQIPHYLTETVTVDTLAPVVSLNTKTRYISSGELVIKVALSEAISKQAGAKSLEAWFNKKRMTLVETQPSSEGESAIFRTPILPTEQQGPGTFALRVSDQAGNVTSASANHLIIDTLSPIVYGIPTEKRRVTTGLLEIGFGINEKLTHGFEKTIVRVVFNDQDMTPLEANSNEFGNWHTFTFPITEASTQGEADIKVYVSDAAGNKVILPYPGILIDSTPAVLDTLTIYTTPESVKSIAPTETKKPEKSKSKRAKSKRAKR